MELRPYQREAIEALDRYFDSRDDNPCVVLPTGSGKSYVIAEMIRRRIETNPNFRCVVLAHRKELVKQNCEEFVNLVGNGFSVGINSAGLESRDVISSVIFAQIQSVHANADDFPPLDMVVVDEAHHIPITPKGIYREFLNGVKRKSPGVRTVGFTATPYRLDVGYVCHKDYVLNEICYEANVGDLVNAGYLCRLRSRVSVKNTPNLEGVSECGGDYNLQELGEHVCVPDLVKRTVSDALSRLEAEHRRCCVWFCVDIRHCGMVKRALAAHGEYAEMVTGETPAIDRQVITERFRRGEIRHLLNVAVFTEGFNVKQVDAVVLLRPTLSRGLYVQMVGRGLRLHSDKKDCVVLDYARCIQEHGPIDQKLDQYIPMEICCQCEEYFPRALRRCPQCGHEVSEEEILQHNACDARKVRVRKMHDEMASCREILSREYGCLTSKKVVNDEEKVEFLVSLFACATACGGHEYNVKHCRLPFDLNNFVEYARDVELANLPDMLRDYFENEDLHASERRRLQREVRQRRNDEIFERCMSDTLLSGVDFSSILNAVCHK